MLPHFENDKIIDGYFLVLAVNLVDPVHCKLELKITI
nr:MAG TPA: hypothetical protein [Bacteriophage sp.]